MDGFSQDNLVAVFAENRQRLSALTEKRLMFLQIADPQFLTFATILPQQDILA